MNSMLNFFSHTGLTPRMITWTISSELYWFWALVLFLFFFGSVL